VAKPSDDQKTVTNLCADVLKAEYLTQLLLDSNYVPLVLKLFAHQDIQQVVDSKLDRIENRYALAIRSGAPCD
jgi:hypothetical protein